MKKIIILVLLISVSCSQKKIESRINDVVTELNKQHFSKEMKKNINLHIDKFITWKIDENKKTYMMMVDYPYQDPSKPIDYLSFTIVKFKTHKQPRVLSISCSSIIDEKKGMSIYFGKRESINSQKIIMSKTKLEKIEFTEVNKDFLKITFDYMKFNEINFLDLFLENDHLFIEIYSKKGEKYNIGYPLFKFKEQFSELK
ncbi:MAG: hypothetical protein U9N76_01210 [Candidatus Marinimicrobia bacterium]|nr:hypothetical protein [Candidatus Neomarinimicrobiota bacterium]